MTDDILKKKLVEQYWLKRWQDVSTLSPLPVFPQEITANLQPDFLEIPLSQTGTQQLEKMSKGLDMALFVLVLSGVAITASRYSGLNDLLIGSMTFKNNETPAQPLLLRTTFQPAMLVKETINAIKQTITQDFKYTQSYHFNEIYSTWLSQAQVHEPIKNSITFILDQVQERVPAFDNTGLLLVLSGNTQQRLLQAFYQPGLFPQTIIYDFCQALAHLLENLSSCLETKIEDLDLLSPDEKKRLLFSFNDTDAAYPHEETLHQLFANQAQHTPFHVALVSTHPGLDSLPQKKQENEPRPGYAFHLDYQTLNQVTDHLAGQLVKKGVQPGDMIGLLVERSPEMVIGILAILKSAAAYVPIAPTFPIQRILYIMKDSQARFLLSTHSSMAHLEKNDYLLGHTLWLDEPFEKTGSPGANVSASDPAYVIYTSGSTGQPKGVVVEHGSAVNVLSALQNKYPAGPNQAILLKTSFIFDVSVAELFGWFPGASRLVILQENHHKDPAMILQAICFTRITHINFVPSMFQTFVNHLNPHHIAFLKPLHYVFLAGEALMAYHVHRFQELAPHISLENLYGPTEGTVYTTWFSLSTWNKTTIIPIGRPLTNVQLYILDPFDRLQPIGVAGQLIIGGTGVARGYLNRPELTSTRFKNLHQVTQLSQLLLTANQTRNIAKPHLYQTGDQARWLVDGNIEFLGRLDDQVKLRGFRIELGEIENHLLTHPDIAQTIVIIKEIGTSNNENQHLCAYIILKNDANENLKNPGTLSDILRDYLSSTLPDYMIPTYFTCLEQFPATGSGKIDRKALPLPSSASNDSYVPPTDDLEKKLITIWADVLNLEEKTLGIDHHFFRLGGHSLKATVLAARIHRELNVRIPLDRLFKNPTIRETALFIQGITNKEIYQPIHPNEIQEYYPLSFNQQRLWFINQENPNSPAFNMPGYLTLAQEINPLVIEKVLTQLSTRHASFRTYFQIINDQPVQMILNQVKIPLPTIDLSLISPTEIDKKEITVFHDFVNQVFDLAHPPLLRVLLIKIAPSLYRLIYCMHHIISDGWSLELFKKELVYLIQLYHDNKEDDQEPLKIAYTDFTLWQLGQIQKRTGNTFPDAYTFWKNQAEPGVPVVQFPGKTTEISNNPKGAALHTAIDETLFTRLNQLAENNYTSLFMVMLTTYAITLRRYTDQPDITIGVISAGRDHESLNNIIGFFVLSLPAIIHIPDEISFENLLQQIHHHMLEVFQYQHYPLEPVFRDLGVPYPPIPIAFNMVNVLEETNNQQLEVFTPQHISQAPDVKFDLEPYVTNYKNGLTIWWSYRQSLFNPDLIEHLAQDYTRLLEFFCSHPQASYNDFRQKSAEQKKKRSIQRK